MLIQKRFFEKPLSSREGRKGGWRRKKREGGTQGFEIGEKRIPTFQI
jgi:hypothetical protein